MERGENYCIGAYNLAALREKIIIELIVDAAERQPIPSLVIKLLKNYDTSTSPDGKKLNTDDTQRFLLQKGINILYMAIPLPPQTPHQVLVAILRRRRKPLYLIIKDHPLFCYPNSQN